MAWHRYLRLTRLIPCLAICFITLAGFISTSQAAANFQILVEWADNSAFPDLAGYRLYADGVMVCSSSTPASRGMVCDVSLGAGIVVFTMTSFDLTGNESQPSAAFELDVPSNWPPIANASVFQVDEDGELRSILSAGDPDGDALVFSIVNGPALGTLLLENAVSGQFVYLPDPDANGMDSFVFQVTDPLGQTSQASVSVNINAINDAPKAMLDFLQARSEVAVEVDLVGNDTDPDGDVLAVGRVGAPLHGTISLIGNLLRYASEPGFIGIDYLTYDVSDGNGGVSTAYFVVNVQPVNWPPRATDLSLEIKTGNKLSGILKGYDIDREPLSFSISSNGFMGSVSIIDPSTGEFSYVPDPGVIGVDMFTFQVSDGKEISQPATVTVAIKPASILPQGMMLETGTVEVDGQWLQVSLQKQYLEPVVVAFPVTMNDEEPGVVQVGNITGSGFELRFREWEYLDGVHGLEMVHYLVMEKGNYTLNDGSKIEAGVLQSNGGQWFSRYDFGTSFPEAPVVVTSVQTVNQVEAAVGRLHSIDGTGFKYKLQNEEGASWEHTPETVGYIAWQVSGGTYDDLTYEAVRTGDLNSHRWRHNSFKSGFLAAPHVVADQQSTDGGNTAGLRGRSLLETGLELQVDEEQSLDDEVYHTSETAGYIALSIPVVP